MLVYVSGPMSSVGPPDFNYRAFHDAAARLRELGYDVLNPAETAGCAVHLPRATYMKIDITYVAAADAMVLLPGWADSDGAKLEVQVARSLSRSIFRYSYDSGLGVPLRVTDVDVRVEPIAYGTSAFHLLSPALEEYVVARTRLASKYVEGEDD